MNRVFWIEGLPGTGKSTLVAGLAARHPDLVIFPKTDIVSVFVKGLGFDFRRFSSPGYRSALAIEELKRAVLDGMGGQDRMVVGERSYVSSFVYYSLLAREGGVATETVGLFRDALGGMPRGYDETVILLEGDDPSVCLARDVHAYSGFWSVPGRAALAQPLYRRACEELGVRHVAVSVVDGPAHVIKVVEELIYG